MKESEYITCGNRLRITMAIQGLREVLPETDAERAALGKTIIQLQAWERRLFDQIIKMIKPEPDEPVTPT